MKSRTLMPITILLIFASAVNVHAQKESVVYNFGSKAGDADQPYYSGIIAQGRDGNLYSTTPNGGADVYFGAVFEVTPLGVLTVLYSFNGEVGDNPSGGLTLGRDGNFYGTTTKGGTSSAGTIFKWITSSRSLSVLHNFTGGIDGAIPYAPPVQGTDGNFYGTTSAGGAHNDGTVYKITPPNTVTPLYQFDNTHGAEPLAPLVQGTDGSFYGTTWHGGNGNAGVVFRITAAGKLTVLHKFCLQPNCADGANPVGPLVQGSDGNFYGTTSGGGIEGYGTVFKITPTENFGVLYSMSTPDEAGADPAAGLVQATDGYFYGATGGGGANEIGSIFKISSAGSFSPLYSFDGPTGSTPGVTPFQHTNGLVYGDTEFGGTGNVSPCTTNNCGVLYSWSGPGLKPFVSLLPYSGKVGNTIEFLGQGFTPSTTVSFNGTAAARTVVSGTYLTATVPNGATTGFVTVTTSGGTLKSNKILRVIPQITGFSPTSGAPDTSVVITGESFTGATSVTFGGVKATSFTVDSYTKITATVPSGAKTGKITVTTPGGTATSSGTFTVT